MTLRTWTSSGGTYNWADTTHWSGGVVPQPGDDATMTGASNTIVQHTAGNESLHTITVANGLNLQFNGGSLATNGTLDIQNGTFRNGVTYSITAGSVHFGTSQGSSAVLGTLLNSAAGTINLQGDFALTAATYQNSFNSPLFWAGGVNNQGLFKKSAGFGSTGIEATFTNSGTVRVESGSIDFLGGLKQTSTGSLVVNAGQSANVNPGSTTVSDVSIAGSITLGANSHLSVFAQPFIMRADPLRQMSADISFGLNAAAIASGLALSGTWTFASGASAQVTAGSLNGLHATGPGVFQVNNSTSATIVHGTNAIDFGMGNFGLIQLSAGSLSIGNVGGTGSMTVGANGTLDFNASVSAGQTLAFAGAYGQIEIDQAGAFGATIAGMFGAFDTIRLAGLQGNAVSVNGSNQLVVTQNGAVIATIQLSAAAAGQAFHIASDNAGGSLIGVGGLYRPVWDNSIIWEDANGAAQLWRTDGVTVSSMTPIGSAMGAGWEIVGRDDLNGDGKLDLVWVQTATGQARTWLMDGTTVLGVANIGGANGAGWTVKATGDLNGDGKADLIWENGATGQVVAFLMNGATVLSGQNIGGPQGAAWDVRGAGDLDGDGHADIILQNRQGQAVGWLMNGASVVGAAAIGAAQGANMSVQGIGDINADGRADLVWQDTNGNGYGWTMNGLTVSSTGILGGAYGQGWRITDLIDFNGDGRQDVVWQSPTGQAQVWLLGANGAVQTVGSLGSPGAGWTMEPSPTPTFAVPSGTAIHYDLSGDGLSDLVWMSNTGQAMVWTMNGLALQTQANIGPANGANWRVEAAGDVNSDQHTDLIWRDSNTGQVVVYEMNGSAIVSAAAVGGANGSQWHVMASGDLDHDGNEDIILENVATGQAVGWIMDGTTIRSAAAIGGANGADWTIRGSGDLNGDGKDDIVWQNSQGQAVVFLMDGLTVLSGAYVGGANGANWQIQGVGDLNGDGYDDIVWQNDQGQAVLWEMNGTNVILGANVGAARGLDYHIRDVAYLDNDGRADIVWETDGGQASAWLMNGTQIVSSGNIGAALGPNWDLFF